MPCHSALRRLSSARAFTLIELLVVILILAILVAIAVPSFLNQTDKAHDAAAKSSLKIAYTAAKAGALVTNGDYGTPADVKASIEASEGSALEVFVGDCLADAVGQPHSYIVVDQTVTGGNSIQLCNDPEEDVWVLTSLNGGAPIFTKGEAPGHEAANAVSDSSGGVAVDVSSPAVGPITIDFATAGSPPDGEENVSPAVMVDSPAAGAGQSNTIVITISAANLPDGATTDDVNVYVDGDPVAGCTATAPATPNPCVSSVEDGTGGSIVVTIKDNGGQHTYTVTVTSAGGGGSCGGSGDNDLFANAQQLNGASGSVNASNESADFNLEQDEPAPSAAPFQSQSSLWFCWVATSSDEVDFDTFGSGFDTVLGIWTGSSLSSLNEVASNDDTSGGQSKVSFTPSQGTTYYVAVYGYGSSTGAIVLTWSPAEVVGPDLDADDDGVDDDFDNCPNDWNPGQDDYNSNGQGDACDVPPTTVILHNATQDVHTDGVGGSGPLILAARTIQVTHGTTPLAACAPGTTCTYSMGTPDQWQPVGFNMRFNDSTTAFQTLLYVDDNEGDPNQATWCNHVGGVNNQCSFSLNGGTVVQNVGRVISFTAINCYFSDPSPGGPACQAYDWYVY